ncbi:MAG: tetratricopeptide repeat protein [Rubrimonas sp.]|uniref:tetratricopeptide repeat protein n=1 Tax=Rubrimonas sp. TaxID=2036015 RepID=UPI002FDD0668
MPSFPRLARALGAVLALWAAQAVAQEEAGGLAGAYLAGRQASSANDAEAAARYLSRALESDPENLGLAELTLLNLIAAGRIGEAGPVAERLADGAPDNRLANLALTVRDLRDGDFAAARARATERPDAFQPLVAPLLGGWAAFGMGDLAGAEALFGSAGDRALFRLFGQVHIGLARLIDGDAEGALSAFDAAFEEATQAPTPMLLARGAALELAGRAAEARALYAERASGAGGDPLARAALARLDAGEPPPLPARDAATGAAEALHGLAGVLANESGRRLALAYARLGAWLRPGADDAALLIAELLEAEGQLEAAARAYAAITPDSALSLRAQIGRANVLRRLEREEAAVEALRAVARRAPDSVEAQLALGDALRATEDWDDAAEAYGAAIALLDDAGAPNWAAFYQRGIAHERGGRWPLAETDFRRALELQPDQPLVLNYLGYSWVDMGENLDEAKAMIERAVELRPEDGYITDSLGWALYRIGDFEGAVEWLEKAVALAPVDPTINDHLGDAYWMVGRRLEAQFQWKRARSFDPEPKDLARIKRKLAVGLDVVLEEEAAAAPPARKAADDL